MTRAVTCRHHDKIKKACTPLFDHFGINNFWFDSITNYNSHAYIGSHVGWCEYFASERLYLNFPYFRHPKFFQGSVSIMEGIQDESLIQILNSARAKFDTHQQSLLLTNKTANGIEFYGFSFSKIHFAAVLNELPLLRLFIKKFREKNRFLLSQMEDNRIDLARLIGPAFYQKSAASSDSRLVAKQEFLKTLGIEIKNPLSSREMDVIKLLREGLSAGQIGKKLFLSKRTVEHHVERMKEKLGCESRAELMQKARELEMFGYLG